MEWTEGDILKLIECFKEEAILWNVNLIDYSNKKKRNEAWDKICNKLKLDKNEVKRKMRNLLDQYRAEKRKCDKKFKSGTDEIYSTWKRYKYFSFLSNKNEVKQTTDSIENKNDSSLKEEQDKEEEGEIKLALEETKIHNVIKSIAQQRDECMIYAEYVAKTLKRINPQERATVKYKINRILFEAEIWAFIEMKKT